MGAILTVVVSAYFFIISYRLQFAFLLFVFLIPFLPKYIGFGVGSEGFALSLKRILLMIFFMAVAISFTQNRKYISKRILQVYLQNRMLMNLLLLFSILKIFSLSINSREFLQYIMLFNDFILTGFVFMLTILLIASEEDINRIIKLFFYGYIVVLILALFESFIKFPPLSVFLAEGMNLARDYGEGIERGGGYRVNGSFVSPITLGEYLVILFPIVITYVYKNKYSLIFKVAFVTLFLYAINSTISRSAILMTGVMAYLYILFIIYKGGSKYSRFVVNMLNLLIVSIAFYFVFNYVSDLIMNFHGRFDKISGGEEAISSTSRALQYVRVYDKMLEAPFFGFGRMTHFSRFLGSTIDNRYFWMTMEVGIIGISVYFLFLFTLAKTALGLYRSPYKNYYVFPLLVSIFLYIPYKILTVGDTNIIYLYIFAGMIAVMKVLQNEKEKT